jgi:CRISPR-associated protein Cas2
VELSGYRLLWLHVLYDLPVTSKAKQKAANEFRDFLLGLGFEMSQYSVYQRCCSGKEMAEALAQQIEQHLPRYGRIHLLTITDKQYEKMKTFHGTEEGMRRRKKENPNQLTLF